MSKIKPLNVTFGLPTTKEPQADSAGRASSPSFSNSELILCSTGIVTLEFENSYLVGTCTPSLTTPGPLAEFSPSHSSQTFRTREPTWPTWTRNRHGTLRSRSTFVSWTRTSLSSGLATSTALRPKLVSLSSLLWACAYPDCPADVRNWKTNYNKTAGVSLTVPPSRFLSSPVFKVHREGDHGFERSTEPRARLRT